MHENFITYTLWFPRDRSDQSGQNHSKFVNKVDRLKMQCKKIFVCDFKQSVQMHMR